MLTSEYLSNLFSDISSLESFIAKSHKNDAVIAAIKHQTEREKSFARRARLFIRRSQRSAVRAQTTLERQLILD